MFYKILFNKTEYDHNNVITEDKNSRKLKGTGKLTGK